MINFSIFPRVYIDFLFILKISLYSTKRTFYFILIAIYLKKHDQNGFVFNNKKIVHTQRAPPSFLDLM